MLATPKSSTGHPSIFIQPSQANINNTQNLDQARQTATHPNAGWMNSQNSTSPMVHLHSQQTASNIVSNINNDSSTIARSSEQMNKIMLLMREQIQIANKFYCDKIKALIHDQAKEICAFRDRLQQNERELAKKTLIIQQLKLQRQSTPSKRKLSIFSQQQQQSQLGVSHKSESNAQVQQKIAQLQSRLQVLQASIAEKHEQQKQMNRKIDSFEKSTIKLMSAKLASCTAKLDQYLIKKQRQIQKIYGDLAMISKATKQQQQQQQHQHQQQPTSSEQYQNPHLHKTISSPLPLSLIPPQQSQTSSMGAKLTRLQKELQQLKQEVAQLRNKEYHYDNCMVDKLKQQIAAIHNNIGLVRQQQQERERERDRDKNSRSKVEIRMADASRIKEFESEKIISNNSFRQNNSTLMRSQKMTTTAHTLSKSPQPRQPQPESHQAPKVLITYGNSNTNNYNHREQQQNNFHNQGGSTLLMNHSTPSLQRAVSDGDRAREQYQGNQVNTAINYQANTKKDGTIPLIKTMGPSHHQLNNRTNPQPQNYNLNAEFFEDPDQEPIEYEQEEHSSSCEQYQQDEEEQNEDIERRLVHTINQQRLSMPLLVQIDQTGCLKCVSNGMYLVDANSDVFYLSEQQMTEFMSKGILRERSQLHTPDKSRKR